jgi:cysteine desulfurase
MSLSGHKLYGPKGVGVLVVKSNCAITPLIKGGEQERSLRGGTSNVAAVVGFAAALERVQSDREEFCRHTSCLRELFEQKVLDALGDKVRIDGEGRVPNISHLTVHGGESLLARLDLHGIYVSGGAACAAHSQLPSHVMLAMGSSEEQARSGIRVSFGKHTTQEETLFAAQTLIGLVSREE